MESLFQDTSSDIEAIVNQVISLLTQYGLDVVGALILLVIGVWVAGWTRTLVARALSKTGKVDATLTSFFASAAKYAVLAVVIIATLNQFGVQTASLIAVLGAAGLAIGLALQGTLSNVAAGVMLLIFRPFKVGDFVEAGGHSGTIKELNLFFTIMATGDNTRITIPNVQVWGGSIINVSAHPTRRVDFVFGVSYEADLDLALDTLLQTLLGDERTLDDPEPFVAVSELADSSVNLVARVWVNSGDYGSVKFALTKAVKEQFDAKGIDIPYPTLMINKP